MKGKSKAKAPDIELHPDAWSRFENAVDVVMRSPPKHRAKAKEHPASKGRVRKGKSRA